MPVCAVSVQTAPCAAATLSARFTVAVLPNNVTAETEYDPEPTQEMPQLEVFVTVALDMALVKTAETEAGMAVRVDVAGVKLTVGACESIV